MNHADAHCRSHASQKAELIRAISLSGSTSSLIGKPSRKRESDADISAADAVNIDEDIFGRLLADPRVNPNQLDGQGRSPLMIAARDGDARKVKILLRCPKVS